MKEIFTGSLLCLLLVSCNSGQQNDTVIDHLTVLTDSTGVATEDSLLNADYAPYGKAKADELSENRKTTLEAILTTRGVAPEQVPALAISLRDKIGFNEWDVVEEGENVQASGSNQEPLVLTSLIFGPFDGNGRGYSVLAIAGNRIYLSEDYWRYTTSDSAYLIQMAGDKKIEVSEETVSITSPSRGKMQLKNIR